MTGTPPPDAPLLDEVHAAFLGGPVAINVASCDANLVPSVARAYGCRVSADRRRVTVFLSVRRSEALLRDLRAPSPSFPLPARADFVPAPSSPSLLPEGEGSEPMLAARAFRSIGEGGEPNALRACRARPGVIAVVFSRPNTHQTIQLKGTDATIVPLGREDRELMIAYGKSFVAEIGALGYKEHFSRALMSPAAEDAVGVEFTPSAAFVQTPGPAAGQRLEPKP